tara:strand:- start:123 stop:569 length:447 start_codon:yes stop_codon:yes gene_type:complete
MVFYTLDYISLASLQKYLNQSYLFIEGEKECYGTNKFNVSITDLDEQTRTVSLAHSSAKPITYTFQEVEFPVKIPQEISVHDLAEITKVATTSPGAFYKLVATSLKNGRQSIMCAMCVSLLKYESLNVVHIIEMIRDILGGFHYRQIN